MDSPAFVIQLMPSCIIPLADEPLDFYSKGVKVCAAYKDQVTHLTLTLESCYGINGLQSYCVSGIFESGTWGIIRFPGPDEFERTVKMTVATSVIKGNATIYFVGNGCRAAAFAVKNLG